MIYSLLKKLNFPYILTNTRSCPICGCSPTKKAFPFATCFNHIKFTYVKCGKCLTVYIDPVPDKDTFELMYANVAHYARYAEGGGNDNFSESAYLLRKNLTDGATVMDYGCGEGGFLKACRLINLVPFGVEFDGDAAAFASKNTNCEVISVEALKNHSLRVKFDAIHLGDVLEHLPNPRATIIQLCEYLKPGGIFFIEGPLERNPSLVFWAARLFGEIKHLINPNLLPVYPPMHLFLISAKAQKEFLTKIDENLIMTYWKVYETGWPYRSGGLIKRSIAKIAIFMGGWIIFRLCFGNRFKAILVRH